jgi:hypothetical protein
LKKIKKSGKALKKIEDDKKNLISWGYGKSIKDYIT